MTMALPRGKPPLFRVIRPSSRESGGKSADGDDDDAAHSRGG